MTDLGEANFCLSIQILQNTLSKSIILYQQKYANEILSKYGMLDYKPLDTPLASTTQLLKSYENEKIDSNVYHSIIGSLLYLSNATCPDLAYSVNYLAWFAKSPYEAHYKATKRILRYLKRSSNYGIIYKYGRCPILSGYTDSNFASDIIDHKSISDNCFSLGLGIISWKSKKQTTTALSTTSQNFGARNCL